WVAEQGRDRSVGAGILMLPEHALVVHFVDVVTRENEHILGLLGANRIDVLINGVGGPHVPVVAYALHGRQDFNEFADFAAENIPAFADLAVEREGLVLSKDVNSAQTGVHAIGKGNVDNAVNAAEGDGRLGAVAGERIKALACASGQPDSERIFHHDTVRMQSALRTLPRTQREILAQRPAFRSVA